MSAYLGCGRLDRHEPHEWTRPKFWGWGVVPARTYQCSGDVRTEGGHWVTWDAEDDAAEERAIRERREAS